MSDTRISVIVPVYNGERLLAASAPLPIRCIYQ